MNTQHKMHPPRVTFKAVIALCSFGAAILLLLGKPPKGPALKSTLKVRNLQALPPEVAQQIIINNNNNNNNAPPPPPPAIKAVAPYNKEDVRNQFVVTERNMLMVFESETGTFKTYVDPKGSYVSGLNHYTNYLLAHALFSNFPVRFSPGAPPLQLLFSTADYPELVQRYDVQQHQQQQQQQLTMGYAPVLQYGTVLRDESILPTFVAMPLPVMTPCIIRWAMKRNIRDKCILDDPAMDMALEGNVLSSWNYLKPQIIWRGSDYSFLDAYGLGLVGGIDAGIDFSSATTPLAVANALMEKWVYLRPRWKGVALSLKARIDAKESRNIPWIDVKFFDDSSVGANKNFEPFSQSGCEVSTDLFMTLAQQSEYKYHIDFGGVGGTTWMGTLTKLAMPGVLFHHETITKDWYYDDIQPWVHYIPIQMDLSDLREKFEWAESHPEEAQAISAAATEFVRNMKTDDYMRDLYYKYFSRHLADVASAYVPTEGETTQSIQEYYLERGIELSEFATCDKQQCVWDNGGNKKYDTSLRPV